MTSVLIAVALAAANPVPKDEKADREFREKVDAAREKAVGFLKKQQGKDGSWESLALESIAGLKGGTTALVTLSLLEAGTPANDPAVTKAVEYLLALNPDKTYVVSLHMQVLARVDAKTHVGVIQANADWLMQKAIRKEKKLLGWSYPGNDIADNSNTHFAIMGLHAAAQAGAKVDPEIWKQVRDYYAATQLADGGWRYHNAGGDHVSHHMTVAALLGLTIATKYDKQAKGPDPAFEKGMKALLGGKLGEFGDGKSRFVSWMTTAELGRALGTTEFTSGKLAKAWYREGAEKMVKLQEKDGSLKYPENHKGGIDAGQPVISTAAGLYLLGPPPAKK